MNVSATCFELPANISTMSSAVTYIYTEQGISIKFMHFLIRFGYPVIFLFFISDLTGYPAYQMTENGFSARLMVSVGYRI